MGWKRIPRLLAFGLMLSGFLLSFCGQVAEAREACAPTLFGNGPSAAAYWEHTRSSAHAFKVAGAALGLAGPVVWLSGWLLTHKRDHAQSVAAPDQA